MTHADNHQKVQTFEVALHRLEQILEKINAGDVPLAEAIALYEEADALMALCNKQLAEAEQKIEVLMRHRDGSLAIGNDGRPLTQPMPPPSPGF